LRMKGFQLSIDDFGTAFSSLTRLRRLPATELKIDRSFISEASTSPEALAIVKSVVNLARDMQMICVAEGIESLQHYRLLAKLGCEVGQGYAISKPLAGDKLAEWKAGWKSPLLEQKLEIVRSEEKQKSVK